MTESDYIDHGRASTVQRSIRTPGPVSHTGLQDGVSRTKRRLGKNVVQVFSDDRRGDYLLPVMHQRGLVSVGLQLQIRSRLLLPRPQINLAIDEIEFLLGKNQPDRQEPAGPSTHRPNSWNGNATSVMRSLRYARQRYGNYGARGPESSPVPARCRPGHGHRNGRTSAACTPGHIRLRP